ncbi:MAG: hypothetical protein QOJ13_1994 [Gaiellales bacterium]|jgi:hypothetical protein|nr:hypothetical protein [Gaiellales bacterium]
MSDVEERLERLEQRERGERARWAREAAAKLDWHTPSDAPKLVELDEINSPEQAAAAVRERTASDPYLARQPYVPRTVEDAKAQLVANALRQRGIWRDES